MCYAGLELLWRRYTHWSMFLLGGLCFVLVGHLKRRISDLALAAAVITALELGCGLLVNRSYQVWDYRNLPFNFRGQICLWFSLLWMPVALGAMLIYGWADKRIDNVCN